MQAVIESLIGTPWWLIAFLAIYGVCWSVYRDIADKDNAARDRWLAYLAENYWLRSYRATLGRALDRIDGWLTPAIPRKRFPPAEVQVAWSSGLLGLTLLLAVAYPAVAVLGQWAVTGGEVRIGPLTLIEPGAALWVRCVTIGLLAMVYICMMFAGIADSKLRRRALGIAATILTFTGAFTLVVEFAKVFGFAFVFAITGSVAFAFRGSGAISFAGGAAVAASAAYVFIWAFGFAFTAKLAGVIALAGAFAGVVFVIGTFLGVQRFLGERTDRPALWLFVFATSVLGAVLAAPILAKPLSVSGLEEFRAIILFLGILPILNALSDFLSIGMTRWTLRRGLAEDAWIWLWMLIDLVAGLAILLLLGASIIAVAHLARLGDGAPLLALGPVFADLRAALGAAPPPEDGAAASYVWLYVMLLTTLAPTAAHLLFASFGGVLQLWPWLRRHIADGLKAGAAGDRVLGRWAVQWMCLAMTLAVAIPVVIIGALWRNADAMGRALLDVMEAWARLIGAL